MHIDCTICNEYVIDLENISVATCGHTFHSSCLKKFLILTKGKLKCPLSSCKMKINEDSIIQTYPTIVPGTRCDFTLQSGCYTMDQGTPETSDQNTTILCTICNDPVTDPENISVTKCGHLFHYYCAKEFAKTKSKRIKCPVTSCKDKMRRATIIKIIPNVVDTQTDDHHYIKDQICGKKETVWENVFKLIQEKFKDPDVTIPNEEALDLMNKIWKLENTQKQELVFEDKQTVGLQFPLNDTYLQQHCKNCEKKEKEIEILKKKMTNMKELKTRYCKQNKYLKEQKKITINQNTSTAKELGQANTLVIEMNKMKEVNEELQLEIQTLQREVVTAREAGICNEALRAELQDFRTRNEEVTEQNVQMEMDIAQLKEEFAYHDSTTTDFMMKELQTSLQNDAFVHDLYEQINNLQDSINYLKRYNDDLQKENDYRWELLMNIHSYAFPGTERRASET